MSRTFGFQCILDSTDSFAFSSFKPRFRKEVSLRAKKEDISNGEAAARTVEDGYETRLKIWKDLDTQLSDINLKEYEYVEEFKTLEQQIHHRQAESDQQLVEMVDEAQKLFLKTVFSKLNALNSGEAAAIRYDNERLTRDTLLKDLKQQIRTISTIHDNIDIDDSTFHKLDQQILHRDTNHVSDQELLLLVKSAEQEYKKLTHLQWNAVNKYRFYHPTADMN